MNEETIFNAFCNAISIATRNLLERKYLYQSIEVSLTDVENLIRRALDEQSRADSSPGFTNRSLAATYKRTLDDSIQLWKNSFWKFEFEETASPQYPPEPHKSESIQVSLPTIKTSCANCDAILPAHNPGYRHFPLTLPPDSFRSGQSVIQIFHFPYECQSCRIEPVIYLVRRQGMKLTLCGRSQLQPIPIPKFITDDLHKYYRSAVIANRTGFTLAGILYLRVLIEQHMRKVTEIKGRYDLSELGESYGKTLPEDFRSRFPSLKKSCDDLSASIHAADDNVELFDKTLNDVERHFDALRLFELFKTK
jgi:hypothetical protein